MEALTVKSAARLRRFDPDIWRLDGGELLK